MDATAFDLARLTKKEPVGPPRVDEAKGLRFIEVSGAALRVWAIGQGLDVVVIVPDPPNVIEHYADLVARISPYARVVVLELPGFGFSIPKPEFDFGIDGQAKVVTELLDYLKVGRATLSFPCLSGFLALAVARKRPDLVKRLVLPQTAGYQDSLAWCERVDRLHLLRTPWLGQMTCLVGKKSIARRWYRAAAPPDAPNSISEPALAALSEGAGFPLASAFQVFRKLDGRRIQGVEAPVVAVWGEADPTHRKTDRDSLKKHVAHTQVVHFWGMGHFPDLEDPGRYGQLLLGVEMTKEGLPAPAALPLAALPKPVEERRSERRPSPSHWIGEDEEEPVPTGAPAAAPVPPPPRPPAPPSRPPAPPVRPAPATNLASPAPRASAAPSPAADDSLELEHPRRPTPSQVTRRPTPSVSGRMTTSSGLHKVRRASARGRGAILARVAALFLLNVAALAALGLYAGGQSLSEAGSAILASHGKSLLETLPRDLMLAGAVGSAIL